MKKILLLLLAMAGSQMLFAQRFEFGVSTGVAYNSSPSWGDYNMGYGILGPVKNPTATPVFFAKGRFNLKKWQFQLSAGFQTLNGRYRVENRSRYRPTFIEERQMNFPMNQLNLSLNRMIIVKPLRIYAGASVGGIKGRKGGSFPGTGFSTGLQVGATRVFSKNWAFNTEIAGKLFDFKTDDDLAIPFTSQAVSATVGLSYTF